MAKFTANDIKRMLSNRHWKDFYLSECKTGASYGTGLLILDGWAMKKSWANPHTYGYEIKVNRQDFLNDEKWQGYLDYCCYLYFVCPWGLIKPEEVGDQAGLMWAPKASGERLVTKKKAPYREVVIPEEIYRYILMSRVVVGNPQYIETAHDPISYWRKWLEDKEEKTNLGSRVSQRLQNEFNGQHYKNEKLRKENESLQSVKETIEALGITGTYSIEERVKEQAENLKNAFPSNAAWRLRSLKMDAKNMAEEADRVLKIIDPKENEDD